MLQNKKIKIGKKSVEAILFKLASKNLIVIKGKKGYIMCGYLNLKTAEKFKEVAVKITGISTLRDAINSRVHSATRQASRLGIHKGQAVKEVLKIIA